MSRRVRSYGDKLIKIDNQLINHLILDKNHWTVEHYAPLTWSQLKKNAKKLETKRNTPQLFLRKTKNHIELGNKTDSCKKEFEKCVQQEIRNNDNLIIPVISRALATKMYPYREI